APAPYVAPPLNVPGYTPPAPVAAPAGNPAAAQTWVNPNGSGTGTETSPHIVQNTSTGDANAYSGVPNSQVSGLQKGGWQLVTTGTAGPSKVGDYQGFGVYDSSRNAMADPNASIAGGTPIWLQKMAAGGPTHAQLLMTGDAAGPNPQAGGAMPEIIHNPTGAPLDVIPNPQQAPPPPDPTGVMGAPPPPVAPPAPPQPPSAGFAGSMTPELPQDAALRELVKHLIEYGGPSIQRFALGTGSSSSSMNNNVYQFGGP